MEKAITPPPLSIGLRCILFLSKPYIPEGLLFEAINTISMYSEMFYQARAAQRQLLRSKISEYDQEMPQSHTTD